MAIGRPIELTPNITSKNISIAATEGQTEFTVTDGYRINELAVYRNGVRLVDGRDFAATNGQTVTLISDTVVADDIIEFSVFDSFDVAGVIVGAASSQTLSGNLHITGELYAGDFKPTNLNVGVVTTNTALHVGSALTTNAAGDVETIGIITAASFSGDGSSLTGVANTDYVVSVATTTGDLTVSAAATIGGAVNIDATTDSTSTSTGALIVDGGLGVAKNVYIGAGLSVAGTLTYEDVTSVDSVGMVTAKSGVNITGGELKVGTAVTIGSAGIITSMGGTLDLKNSGSVSNIKLYCESGNSHYTQIQSAAHGSYSGNVTLTLPTTTDTLIGKTTTDTLTNKTLTSPTLTTPVFSGAATGEFKVGTAVTISSTAGVSTFNGDIIIQGATGTKNITWDKSNDWLMFSDSTQCVFGNSQDMKLYHDGSNAYVANTVGSILIQGKFGESSIECVPDGKVEIRYDNAIKFATTNDGVKITGIATVTEGLNTDGLLSEKFETVANKLSAAPNIDLEDGMVHYFTTQETTTATPNIRYSSSKSLNNMLSTGDAITVTLITTAAAAGYSANWTIDGSAVTEEWVGGSAPSEGGSDGFDIYTANILKTGSGAFKVFINLVNAT